MINYSIKNFEIFHYDLYRIKNDNELLELNMIENLNKNITVVEWPQMIINSTQINNYYYINFNIVNARMRIIKIQHTRNKRFNNEF